jgi:hypothetical protein
LAGRYRGVDLGEGAVAPDLADVEDEPPDIWY